jgi:apolipoprotein D and lipocalin family protein
MLVPTKPTGRKMNCTVFFDKRPALWRTALAATALTLSMAGGTAQAATTAPLQTVPEVDLARYQGLWYQVAHYPNLFQKQCASDTTALYAPLPNGQISVTNTCKKADGSISQVVGAARVHRPLFPSASNPITNAKLEVRFAPAALSWLPLVWAPYWVIQLADDYRYAVVSEASRNYLWILSRTPQLSETDRETIRARLVEQGFDLSKLVDEPRN